MVRRAVLAGVIGFFGGLFVGGILLWLDNQRRLRSIEQRLMYLESRVGKVEKRILEFQDTYYEDKAEIEYRYSLLKREMEQLKLTSLSKERKEELDAWLDYLAQLKDQKMQQAKQKRRESFLLYIH